MTNDSCSTKINYSKRRNRYQNRKLELLNYIKDSLERRLAAITASISTLENQIERDNIKNMSNESDKD
ncbi:hypothetical protein [Prochlorococcus sp. MIT 1307]|uniref:hypothetical protein n=1 Tax=Prochlorococcus sp. MIT 1307 TaxID=3096219 RepID=UPI002A75ABD7|nr:hypothetical protein [Prochlorococcus sp. MIT 1307]